MADNQEVNQIIVENEAFKLRDDVAREYILILDEELSKMKINGISLRGLDRTSRDLGILDVDLSVYWTNSNLTPMTNAEIDALFVTT